MPENTAFVQVLNLVYMVAQLPRDLTSRGTIKTGIFGQPEAKVHLGRAWRIEFPYYNSIEIFEKNGCGQKGELGELFPELKRNGGCVSLKHALSLDLAGFLNH